MFARLQPRTYSCSWRPPLASFRNYATANAVFPLTRAAGHANSRPTRKVEVDANHGLWHFFRKKEVDGKVLYETIEPPNPVSVSGRSWTAPELRRKSFSDLHTLWYVVLRERNLLATQREEARRIGVRNREAWTSLAKMSQCRKTMARIKGVLNERRLAYEGAVKLLHEKRAGSTELSSIDEKARSEVVPEEEVRSIKKPDEASAAAFAAASLFESGSKQRDEQP